MANKFPLILNTSANQIQELASGDNLDLTGSGIHNAGVITATSFSGNITGGVTGNADTATLATNVTVTANNSTNETVYPLFVDGATGTQGAESDTGLTYNPSSGNLTSTQFTGTLQTAAQTNITSVGTLSSLNVSGNVSIGGTLTYEDVTNIDSVGLITARNGVSVTSGGIKVLAGVSNFNANIVGTASTATSVTVTDESSDTLTFPLFVTGSVSGGLVQTANLAPQAGSNFYFNSSTGALSATSFSGSGASLTALNASNLGSGTVPTARLGSGTANNSVFLRGDNTWATVTTTTINSNADNRVITGSGTANTLEGEANLTFNGSTLALTGSQTISGSESVSGDLDIAADIRHIGDENTRISFSGSDTIQLRTGGDARVQIEDGNTTINNNVFLPDNVQLKIGNTVGTPDFKIYHDGNNRLHASNGYMQYRAVSHFINDEANSVNFIRCEEVSSNKVVKLACNGATKLETKTDGVEVTGNIIANGALTIKTDDVDFIAQDSTDSTTNFIWRDHSASKLYLGIAGSAVINTRSDVIPYQNDTYNLGTTSLRWANAYVNDMHFSNEGKSNSVDGTWGDWTLQEGDENIFMLNNRTGKKYKMNLTEVS